LILAYCEISPYVLRSLIHSLKLWASAQEINDPSGKKGPSSMSSYCLTLMAIGYLQYRGNLPNLQVDVKYTLPDRLDLDEPDVVWVGWRKPQGIKAHVSFEKIAPRGWKPREPDLTASEALRGFFAFFSLTSATPGSPRFDFANQIVSVLNGGVIKRAYPQAQQTCDVQARIADSRSNETRTKEKALAQEMMTGKGDRGIQPRNWGERRLVVQDPFIWQKVNTISSSAEMRRQEELTVWVELHASNARQRP
jgi:hypothetical protein